MKYELECEKIHLSAGRRGTCLAGCGQKETTVTNPPAAKKESSNYEEKKDGTDEFSQMNTPPAETSTEEKSEVNVFTSPSPSP